MHSLKFKSVTVLQRALELGFKPSAHDLQVLGMNVLECYRKEMRREPTFKVNQNEWGTTRKVFCYYRNFWEYHGDEILRTYFSKKARKKKSGKRPRIRRKRVSKS